MAAPAPLCPACGRPLRAGARFCTACGTTAPAPPPAPSPLPAPGAPGPPRNRKPLLLMAGAGLAVALVAVLVIRSQGGDGGNGAIQPGSTRPAGTTTAGPGLPRAEAAALLLQYSRKAQGSTYRVAYDEGGKNNVTGEAFKLTSVYAAEPPKRSARLEGDLGPGEGLLVLIDDGKDFYQCSQPTGGEGVCDVRAGATSNALRLGYEELLFNLSADTTLGLEETAKREIAGRSARCFKVSGYEGQGTLCVDSDLGVVLAADGRFQDASLKLAATGLATKPTAADFKVPFELPEAQP